MAHNPDLAYTFLQKIVGGRTTTFVSSACSKCSRQSQFSWTNPNNPSHIAQRFRRIGWDYDPTNARKNLCPDCNPHHKNETLVALPTGFKTPGERVVWLRIRTKFTPVQVADASGIPMRLYQQLEQNEITNFNTFHTTIAAIVPFFKRHGLPVTLRWIVGLLEEGSCLAHNFKVAMASMAITPGFLAAETETPVTTIEGILNGSIQVYRRLDILAEYLQTTPEILMSDIAPLVKEPKVLAVIPPTPPPAPPAPIEKITPKGMQSWRELVANRLRTKRRAERLSQGDLAKRVVVIGMKGVNVDTVQSYISAIENANPVSRADDILSICAGILNTSPAWQCGTDGTIDPEPAVIKRETLPRFHIDIDSANAALRQITALKADVVGLEGIIHENIGVIERLVVETSETNKLLVETRGKITLLESSILALMAAPTQASPVTVETVTVPLPSQPPPILTATPDAPVAAPEMVLNADSFCTWVSNARIDREADTKQNSFARLLTPSRFGDQEITLKSIMLDMQQIISTVLLPDVQKPKEALRRMVYREALAPNGRLVQTGTGSWKLRETSLAGAAD